MDPDGFLALRGESIHSKSPSRKSYPRRCCPAAVPDVVLAHEVLEQVWAVAARFVSARRRRGPGRAVKTPECSSPPIPAMRLASSHPDHEPNHG